MRLPLVILERLLKKEDRAEILGDLEEGYTRRAPRQGRMRAGWWLWRQVFTIPAHLAADRVSLRRKGSSWSGPGKKPPPLDGLLRDVRFGFRGLRRRPVFAVAAVLTLMVGSGMTTTMFTLVDAVLLRPLPGSNAQGMVYLQLESTDGRMWRSPSPELLRLIRDHASSFSRVEAYSTGNYAVSVEGEPLRVYGAQASVGFFSFLGVRTQLGRGFRPGDDKGAGTPVVVLSHTFWAERFGGSPGAPGRTMIIQGRTHEIVGVLPLDFRVDTPREAQFWIPEGAAGELFAEGAPLEGALASLAPGVTIEQARAELDALVRNNPLDRRADTEWKGRVNRPADLIDPALRRALLILQAGAVLVLLIASLNLTNLLLAQGEGRARELALRASLGAGRGRLVRQLLTECAVLGALGGAGGVLLTLWALDALPLFLPPGYAGFSINGPVLLASLAVSMTAILLAGLFPALTGSTRSLAAVLKGRARRRRGFLPSLPFRQALVSVEVAMAFVLLVSAGLLLKSFAGLAAADVGFPRENLLTLRVELAEEEYADAEAQLLFLDRLREEMARAVPPELGEATLASGLIENLSAAIDPLVPEGAAVEEAEPEVFLTWGVTPDYFQVVGLPVTEGRGFLEGEGEEGEKVVILSQGVARRYFPEQEAAGRRLRLDQEWYRVVGVARAVNLPSLARSHFRDLQLFFPFAQDPGDGLTVIARLRGDGRAGVDLLKDAVWEVDPTLPIMDVSLVEDALMESLTQERSNALLMVLFALTALVLGGVGIYGVVAYSVGRQIREIGIRLALGATQGGEVGRVVARGMGTVLASLVLGGVGVWAVGTVISDLLVEVSPRDPLVLGLGISVVAGVAFLATWLPARRAAGAGPVESLRGE